MTQTQNVILQLIGRAAAVAYIFFSFALCTATGQNPALDAESRAAAVSQARVFLESSAARQTVLLALHPLATDLGQGKICGKEERGDTEERFTLTCEFKWSFLGQNFTDTVTFQFDSAGKIVRVVSATSTSDTPPFWAFDMVLEQLKDASVDAVIDKMFSSDDQTNRDKKTKWITKKIAESAISRPNAQTILGWILGLDQSESSRDVVTAESAMPPVSTLPAGPTAADAFAEYTLGPVGKRASRQYRGDLDGFVAALPDYLKRAATDDGVPERSYSDEIAYIADAARRCAGITPQMAAKVTVYGMVATSQLGEPYRVCSAPNGALVPGQAGMKDKLVLGIHSRGKWGEGKGMTVIVSYADVDRSVSANKDHGIMSAVIDAPIGSARDGEPDASFPTPSAAAPIAKTQPFPPSLPNPPAAMLAEQQAAGEWVDLRTGLMWTLKDNGSDINWKKANEYCQVLRTGGFSDWRLPSIEQLWGLYDPSSTRMTAKSGQHFKLFDTSTHSVIQPINGSPVEYHINGGIVLTATYIWTVSRASGNLDQFAVVKFRQGRRDFSASSDKTFLRALCVRHSQ